MKTNLGGRSHMLGQWRIVLRQAEESARAGRLDEALALVGRPDVAERRQAVQLRGRLLQDLIARASRRAEADDLEGAVADLDLADRHHASPDLIAAARMKIAEHVAGDVQVDLDAGEPGRVLERLEHLARHHISGPALRRLREAAESWQKALDEMRRGEFGNARDQLDRAERLAGERSRAALADTRRDLEGRQQAVVPQIERLYQAVARSQWAEALAAAEAVLAVLPEHSAARQARARAWQHVGGLNPAALTPRGGGGPAARGEGPDPADGILRIGMTPAPRRPAGPRGRFLLWADAVGGYLVCLDDEVVLGRAAPDGTADVPLLGDLSRRHACLVRSGDSYVLRAIQPTFVNGRRVDTVSLNDGDIIRLGGSLELEFHQPSPISATARLEVVSRHRLALAVDGVILMAENCIIGPSAQAHIPARHLEAPVVLYRHQDAIWCRAPGGFEVDGKPATARAALTLRSSVLGEGFSFSLEELGPPAPVT